MTGINEIVKGLSDIINICDKYGMFGIADEIFEIIKEVSPYWESERMESEESCMKVESGFFTVIVIAIGIFGSEIINEKHFKTEDEARLYSNSIKSDGNITLIAQV